MLMEAEHLLMEAEHSFYVIFLKNHTFHGYFLSVFLKKFLFSEFPQIITNNSHSSIAISIKVL
jgi:hypothetical protein